MPQSGDKSQKKTNERRLILYKPHFMQLKMHNSLARFRVAAFGRQSGKSTFAINEITKRAWENPGTRYWFLSPTYDQAKGQYRRLTGMLYPCREVMVKNNMSELRVKLINNSEIVFKSGEVLDNLRGETLHGAIIDEVREQHRDLWPMVIRPMLTTTKGWAAFISTPNGFDAFYDLFQRAERGDGWEAFQAPSTCNPAFTQDEFDSARKEMSEAEFAQEYLAEFRDLTAGRAYINFGQHNHVFQSPFCSFAEWHPSLPIIVAMDFNLSPMAWTLGQRRADDFYWGDEIFLRNSHTQEAVQVLIEKVRGHKVGVELVGDATGKAGQRAAAGKSDYDIICRALSDAGIR